MGAEYQNILTPLDLFGSLITERKPGESLAAYRQRVEQVAANLALRDRSSPDWVAWRESELSGHLGMPVRLIPGDTDEDLIDEAYARRLTLRRLETLSGPVRWGDIPAGGDAPLYNRAFLKRGGVIDENHLRPARDGKGNVYASSGIVAIPSAALYYISGSFEDVYFDLPDGTTETALIPFTVEPAAGVAPHGHRIDIVDESTLQLVADDHTHTLTYDGSSFTMSGGGHTHPLRPIAYQTRCIAAVCPTDPIVSRHSTDNASVTGSDLDWGVWYRQLPYLSPVLVEVDEHSVLVDPVDYWKGSFTLPAEDHVHVVENWIVQEAAGHTHTLNPPVVPSYRTLYVIPTDKPLSDDNPYILETKIDRGWVVVRNAHGLGPRLCLSFINDKEVKIPVSGEGIYSIQRYETGRYLHIAEEYITSFEAEFLLISEDSYTGAVPLQRIWIESDAGHLLEVRSDYKGEARVRIGLPDKGVYVFTMKLLDKDDNVLYTRVHTIDSRGKRGPVYGYGNVYGLGRPVSEL
ncbi:MAG: hypothetical protein D6800_03155 [Candidatus Zixiibacteriota bacterium]|nr:MAG: hypothetical protein D6800_03155 [candidate division Zixibacteria bacterium]